MKAALALLAACALSVGLYIALGRRPDATSVDTSPEPATEWLDDTQPPPPGPEPDVSTIEADESGTRAPVATTLNPAAAELDLTPVKVTITAMEGFGSLFGSLGHTRKPLPGVAIALQMGEGPEPWLASGKTGSDGKVVLSVPKDLLQANERGRTEVRARVIEAGYMPNPSPVWRREVDDLSTFSAGIRSTKGWVQLVEILGEAPSSTSRPVSVLRLRRNMVRKVGHPFEKTGMLPDNNSYVLDLGDGKYELRLRESEKDRWLIVDGGRNGRASWQVVKPEAQETMITPLRIDLQGPAKLLGRVLDARGEPAPGVSLRATWIPAESTDGLDASREPIKSDLMRRGEGQFEQWTGTDAEGRYSFEGLMDGTFRIDAMRSTEDGWRFEEKPLGTQIASPEPVPAEWVFTRPIIVVTVDSGPDEAPCNLVLYDAGAAGSTPWARPKWHFSGMPVPSEFARLYGATSDRPDYDGRMGVFEVQGGRQYFLMALGPDYDPTPQLVQVPEGGVPAVAMVGPPKARAMGTLRIQLTLGELEKPEGADEWYGEGAAHGVFVQSVESAIPLGLFDSTDFQKGPPELRVPAGPVRVVAVGLPHHEGHHGTLMSPRLYGRTQKIVDVKPNAVTTAEIELACNGGHLIVTLTGDITVADKAYVAAEIARMQEDSGYVGSDERERILRGALHLENRSQRIFVPVNRTALAMMDSSAGGSHTLNEWPMGETHTSNVLPPGSYTLHATFPGRAPIEVGVTITDGETTEVKLDFGG